MDVKKKTRLNELDGTTWTRYSISVWDIVKTREENKLHHPAMFPLELCSRLIEIYTRPGDVILDPFLGSGSTVVAARGLRRKGVGVEVNPSFLDLARRRLSQQNPPNPPPPEPELYCDDANNLLEYVKAESVDLVITSPPYWRVHLRKRTADYKPPRPYSSLEKDLGNMDDYWKFMEALKLVFTKIHRSLKPGKRCIIVVMDLRVKSRFIPFHVDIISKMREVGFVLEDIILWDRKREYNNLRPLGYPYVFVVNKIHEYITIFRKEQSPGGLTHIDF